MASSSGILAGSSSSLKQNRKHQLWQHWPEKQSSQFCLLENWTNLTYKIFVNHVFVEEIASGLYQGLLQLYNKTHTYPRFLFVYLFVCLFFETGFLCSFRGSSGISSCRPDWPWTHRDPLASASQVLGLKTCVPTAWLVVMFYHTYRKKLIYPWGVADTKHSPTTPTMGMGFRVCLFGTHPKIISLIMERTFMNQQDTDKRQTTDKRHC